MKLKLLLALILLIFLVSCSGNELTGNLELKEKTQTQELDQAQLIGTNIGETPPDFTVVSTDGKAITLSKLLEQKKPAVVYFMATWCPYCAKDYAALSKVYKKYEDNITFISISLDLSEDFLELKEYKKKYPELQKTIFAQGQEKILINYGITKTTTKYAIARNGTIIYQAIGVFDEEQWIILFEALKET